MGSAGRRDLAPPRRTGRCRPSPQVMTVCHACGWGLWDSGGGLYSSGKVASQHVLRTLPLMGSLGIRGHAPRHIRVPGGRFFREHGGATILCCVMYVLTSSRCGFAHPNALPGKRMSNWPMAPPPSIFAVFVADGEAKHRATMAMRCANVVASGTPAERRLAERRVGSIGPYGQQPNSMEKKISKTKYHLCPDREPGHLSRSAWHADLGNWMLSVGFVFEWSTGPFPPLTSPNTRGWTTKQ